MPVPCRGFSFHVHWKTSLRRFQEMLPSLKRSSPKAPRTAWSSAVMPGDSMWCFHIHLSDFFSRLSANSPVIYNYSAMHQAGRFFYQKLRKTFRWPLPSLSAHRKPREKEAAYSLNRPIWFATSVELANRFKTCLSNFSKVWPPAGPPEAILS